MLKMALSVIQAQSQSNLNVEEERKSEPNDEAKKRSSVSEERKSEE